MAKKPKRPPTIKEMQKAKEAAKKDEQGTVYIENISKQLIVIHCRAPKGVDFYIGAQDIRILPGKSARIIESRLWEGQIETLQKRKKISVRRDRKK